MPPTQKSGAPGGFRWLQAHGAWYPQAQHRVMNALTAPGHATILTGAYPARTGIVLNQWYQGPKRAMCYCVGDEGYALVGTRPPGKPRGTAPTALLGNTLGDELKLARPGARVASIALKDRAAILLGGFSSDAALWFDPTSFQWVSSTFYATERPLAGLGERPERRRYQARGQAYVWEATAPGSGASADGELERVSPRVHGRLSARAGAAPPAIDHRRRGHRGGGWAGSGAFRRARPARGELRASRPPRSRRGADLATARGALRRPRRGHRAAPDAPRPHRAGRAGRRDGGADGRPRRAAHPLAARRAAHPVGAARRRGARRAWRRS
jgi:hypothetical protein